MLEMSSFQKSLKWLALLVPVSSQACASECADFISFGFWALLRQGHEMAINLLEYCSKLQIYVEAKHNFS